ADLILKGVRNAIAHKELTFDLALLREAIRGPKRNLAAQRTVDEKMQRLVPGATLVGTAGFGDSVIRHMGDAPVSA
ncbi:MAG: NADP-dependent isocitrate dehydrogenase, partial [Gammaproteobacteria bacterium]|nr:NADP-dependent isocitrate dehydrogenase [Gammaproteobacteria bacterium]